VASDKVIVAHPGASGPGRFEPGGMGAMPGPALRGRAAAGYSRRPLWTISQLRKSLPWVAEITRRNGLNPTSDGRWGFFVHGSRYSEGIGRLRAASCRASGPKEEPTIFHRHGKPPLQGPDEPLNGRENPQRPAGERLRASPVDCRRTGVGKRAEGGGNSSPSSVHPTTLLPPEGGRRQFHGCITDDGGNATRRAARA
jgi:hypothetical protein